MLQPFPQPISPILPYIIRTTRMAHLPNLMQTRVPQANDAEEMVKEVHEWAPAEVGVLHRVFVSLENPVGWYLWNVRVLCLVVVAYGRFGHVNRVRRCQAHS